MKVSKTLLTGKTTAETILLENFCGKKKTTSGYHPLTQMTASEEI